MKRILLALLLAIPLAAQSLAQTSIGVVNGGGNGNGSGTVTSVAATVPSFMQVTGSPVTTSGTLVFSFPSNTARSFLGAPSNADGVPLFRLLVSADIPNNAANTSGTAGGLSGTSLTGDVTNSGNAITIAANSVALGTDTTGGYAASATEGGSATSVAADSVALGTDTTGGYAASTTEGGPATTATALAANGANCSAGNYPLGVDASGAVENCTAVTSGDTLPVVDTTAIVKGSSDATKLFKVEADGMTTANTITLNLTGTAAAPVYSSGAGAATKLASDAPTQAAAAQTGTAITIQSSAAVDGSSTHAAVNGGNINLTTGAGANPGGLPGMIVTNAGEINLTNGSTYFRATSGMVFGVNPATTLDGLYLSTANATTALARIFNTLNNGRPLLTLTEKSGQTADPFQIFENDGTTVVFKVDTNGHAFAGGPSAPSVAGSCGTSPSIAGKDDAHVITTGTGSPTSCAVTFAVAYATAPVCVANAQTTTTPLNLVSTTTTVTVSAAALTASEKLYVHCRTY